MRQFLSITNSSRGEEDNKRVTKTPKHIYGVSILPYVIPIDDICVEEQDGRGEALVNMHRELEKCERALNEYLDMKKNVFPRFVSVSRTPSSHIRRNNVWRSFSVFRHQ